MLKVWSSNASVPLSITMIVPSHARDENLAGGVRANAGAVGGSFGTGRQQLKGMWLVGMRTHVNHFGITPPMLTDFEESRVSYRLHLMAACSFCIMVGEES